MRYAVDVQCLFCETIFRTEKANYIARLTKSCGCLQKSRAIKANTTHGHSAKKSNTYSSWKSMWNRVSNKNSPDYKYYGGRGIAIHPEWAKFENFLRDLGERPLGKTLDRINNNEGYEMNNCRWATRKEQSLNSRHYHIGKRNNKGQIVSLGGLIHG
jgi:hypothetical protein